MRIAGVTADSRQVQPGYVFVAIKGQQSDGHQFIPEAIRRGACAVVVENTGNLPPIPSGVLIWQVPNSRAALAEIACTLYRHPSSKLVVIGVTGTNGKTTTCHLCHHLLSEDIRIGLIGSVRVDTTARELAGEMTTPESTNIQEYLDEMVRYGARAVVMEVSSHGIKQERIRGTCFDAAVFTNLSPDHSDFHQDFQEYLQCKTELFRLLPQHGLAVLNLDDPHAGAFVQASKCRQAFFSLDPSHPQAHLTANILKTDRTGTLFEFQLKPGWTTSWGEPVEPLRHPVFLPLPGEHNVSNCLAAFGLALWQGADARRLAARLATFPGVPRRLQILQEEPWWVIDDYAHNPDNFRCALRTVAAIPYRRLHLLVAIRGNRGAWINRQIADQIVFAAARTRLSTLVATDSLEATGLKDRVSHEERTAFWQQLDALHGVEKFHETRLDESIRRVWSGCLPGDALLMLGAQGLDQAQELLARITNEFMVWHS